MPHPRMARATAFVALALMGFAMGCDPALQVQICGRPTGQNEGPTTVAKIRATYTDENGNSQTKTVDVAEKSNGKTQSASVNVPLPGQHKDRKQVFLEYLNSNNVVLSTLTVTAGTEVVTDGECGIAVPLAQSPHPLDVVICNFPTARNDAGPNSTFQLRIGYQASQLDTSGKKVTTPASLVMNLRGNMTDTRSDSKDPVIVKVTGLKDIDPNSPLRVEYMNIDGVVLHVREAPSFSALEKMTVTRDGKPVEVSVFNPDGCPLPSPAPTEGQAVASLQGLTQTKVTWQPTRMLIDNTHTPSELSTFIQTAMRQHAGHSRTLDPAIGILRNWDEYRDNFTDVGHYTAQFKSANGTIWKVSGGIFGPYVRDGVASMQWQFPKEVPDSLFVGDRCNGRLELLLPFANGSKQLMIYSQDFVLAEKSAAASTQTLRLNAEATQNVRQQPKTVTLTATYKDGADGLYARLRQSYGNLPERSGLGYGDIDKLWLSAGGKIDTYFQPGTLQEGDSDSLSRTSIGSKQEGSVDVTAKAIALTVPWPKLELIKKFETSEGQGPVTGYMVRSYRYNDKPVVDLVSYQVDTRVRMVESVVSSGGGSSGNVVVAPAAPTIATVSPNSGVGATVITIAGTNFRAGATVKVGGVAATGVTVVSATSITATSPPGLTAGAHNVVVTNSDSTTVTSVGAYTVPAPPTITSISPNSGPIGSILTLAGTNFRAGAGVTIGGVAATGVNVVSATSITATVPAGLAATAHNVVVTNTDTTTVTSVLGYTVTAGGGGAPTITAGVYQGANNLPFTINGTNFVAGATMTIGGQDAAGNVTSSTTIDGFVPAGLAGGGTQYDIVITNPDSSTVTLPNGFTVF